MKKFLSLLLALCFVLVPVSAQAEENVQYYPLWMQANTIIVYDNDKNATIVQGGYLSDDAIDGRADIAAVGFTSTEDDMIALANTKVVYDHHGFIQNIYFELPIGSGDYQLKNPMSARANTGFLGVNDPPVTYGSYYNYDTQSTHNNVLSRDGNTIYGTGRITFYVGGPHGENPNHNLVYNDCATKMYVCDVPGGTEVLARNTYTGSGYVTFHKHDCGSLPKAILDIWSDSNYNPITELTTRNRVDNVYSGQIRIVLS